MRESDLAEIWEDALRRMRDCFDLSDNDVEDRSSARKAKPRRGEEGGARSAAARPPHALASETQDVE